jgi:septum formation protein
VTRLLLASKSQARQAMLRAAGVAFELVDTACDEEEAKLELRTEELDAAQLAAALAKRKALSAKVDGAALVLGCDQTLELDNGRMLDKPASRADARAQLETLSGRTHRLHSAAVIVEGGAAIWSAVQGVSLSVRPLTSAFIETYLDAECEAIRWGVGGYRIEGPGVQLFERIEGSHFAILGLPLLPLIEYLRERGLLLR